MEDLEQLGLLVGEDHELILYLYDPVARTETARISLGYCQSRKIELDEETAIFVMWPPVAAIQQNQLVILQQGDPSGQNANRWLAQVWELTEGEAYPLIQADFTLEEYADISSDHIYLVDDRLYLLAAAGWQMNTYTLCCLKDFGLTAMAQISSIGGQEDQDSRMLWNYQVPEELTRRLKLYDHETTGDYRMWRQLDLKASAP